MASTSLTVFDMNPRADSTRSSACAGNATKRSSAQSASQLLGKGIALVELVEIIGRRLLGIVPIVSDQHLAALEVPVANGMTGAQVARRILDANGLNEVPVEDARIPLRPL